ncbi:MAG: hypothetical protein JWN60_2004 [Acidobacteria bacterium]|nr:hypothetical protein [Acidobacteriota bacterium]
MKQCPTCQRTFDDSMRFCQTDGTPLIEINETATEDQFKTTVGRQEDFNSANAPDPFKTMVGGFPKKDESNDLLEIDEDQDSLKTMFVSDREMKREMAANDPKKDSIIEVPPLTSDSPAGSTSGDESFDYPPAPKFNEPNLSAPRFGDISSSTQTDSPASGSASNPFGNSSSYEQKPLNEESSGSFDNSPFNQPSPRIPSPFSDEKPTSFDAPSTPLPTYKETEPLGYDQNDLFSQSPFGQSSMPVNQPLQQTEWKAPPAPEYSWQNQQIGANTPFQPPVHGSGQNQTLAIVSLVLGIIGIVLCQITAPAAIVTGFMARKKAAQNPNEYGGSGLALAGIITGAIGTLFLILLVIYIVVVLGVIAGQGL